LDADNENQEGERLFGEINQYLEELQGIVAEQYSRKNYE
jgi:hypothetical protein